jgi:hypothetical protein
MPPKKSKEPPQLETFVIEVYGETMWTLNKERSLHHYQRAKLVKEWREAAAAVATAKKIPKRLRAIEVRFIPHRRNGKGKADTGGHFPVAKACIDGLVDAGILWEDGPEIVQRLIFEAPIVSGESKVVLHITELEPR